MTTAAQEEFNDLVAKNASTNTTNVHPEDRSDNDRYRHSDLSDEEDVHRKAQIDAAMRTVPGGNTSARGLRLPPASFDSGRSTGVKGVIADARSYETAKKNKWRTRVRDVRNSMFAGSATPAAAAAAAGVRGADSDSSNTEEGEEDNSTGRSADEEDFLSQWRETRRKELESMKEPVRQRRTSPSARTYGRLDEVDALGYLDAIEKVGRDTTVVVFVYDQECEVSEAVEAAMRPLVQQYTAVHFVKVHYDEIEFDPAAVPSILAYRNQGDLVANLTGIIEMIPDDEGFGMLSLQHLLKQHGVL